MTYQDQLEEQTSTVVAQVLAALAMWEAAKLTTEALVAVVAAYIAAGNSAATALADLSLSAAVTIQTGQAAAPLGITRPADDPDRLHKAAQTILDDLTVPDLSEDYEAALASARMRLQRLADAESKEAAARAYSTAVAQAPPVTGWTRGISGTACQLCRWWAREGRVWDADHTMPTHKGCTCSQLITTTERTPA